MRCGVFDAGRNLNGKVCTLFEGKSVTFMAEFGSRLSRFGKRPDSLGFVETCKGRWMDSIPMSPEALLP